MLLTFDYTLLAACLISYPVAVRQCKFRCVQILYNGKAMSRKGKRVAEDHPPEDDAFVRLEEPVEDASVPSFRKVKIPVTADGIDWSSIPDEQRAGIVEKLANDAEVLTHLASAPTEEGAEELGPPTYLRKEHSDAALELFALLERKLIPPAVAKIIKRPLAPEVIEQAYNFTDEQKEKIGPSLLEFGEDVIPEKYKKIIAYGSDKYKFIGLIAWAIKEQTQAAVKMQLEYESLHPPAENPNKADSVQ